MKTPKINYDFTAMPNDVMSAMFVYKGFSYKERIFLVICRKTYGFHKEMDWISLSQIEGLTGIAQSNICNNIKVLVRDGLVIKNTEKKVPRYKINREITEWNNLSKSISDVVELDNEDYQIEQCDLSDSIDTKETITKENNTKKDIYENEQLLSIIRALNKNYSILYTQGSIGLIQSLGGSMGSSANPGPRGVYLKIRAFIEQRDGSYEEAEKRHPILADLRAEGTQGNKQFNPSIR